jgi:hypothetical protein
MWNRSHVADGSTLTRCNIEIKIECGTCGTGFTENDIRQNTLRMLEIVLTNIVCRWSERVQGPFLPDPSI